MRPTSSLPIDQNRIIHAQTTIDERAAHNAEQAEEGAQDDQQQQRQRDDVDDDQDEQDNPAAGAATERQVLIDTEPAELTAEYLQDITTAQRYLEKAHSKVQQVVSDQGTYTRKVTTISGNGLTISENMVQLLLGTKSLVTAVFVHGATQRKWEGFVADSDPGFRVMKFSTMLKDMGAAIGDTIVMKRMKNRVDGWRAVAVELEKKQKRRIGSSSGGGGGEKRVRNE